MSADARRAAAEKVIRTRWVDYGSEGYARLPEDATAFTGVGVEVTVSAADYDKLQIALDAKEERLGRATEYLEQARMRLAKLCPSDCTCHRQELCRAIESFLKEQTT